MKIGIYAGIFFQEIEAEQQILFLHFFSINPIFFQMLEMFTSVHQFRAIPRS